MLGHLLADDRVVGPQNLVRPGLAQPLGQGREPLDVAEGDRQHPARRRVDAEVRLLPLDGRGDGVNRAAGSLDSAPWARSRVASARSSSRVIPSSRAVSRADRSTAPESVAVLDSAPRHQHRRQVVLDVGNPRTRTHPRRGGQRRLEMRLRLIPRERHVASSPR